MELSNTAVPTYYGRFRDAVIRGEIPVNKYVAMEMRRIDWLIENPGIYYAPGAIDGYVAFCEEELTLTDGSDLHLLDTFKLWAEQVFAWWYCVDRNVYSPETGHYERVRKLKRLCNKQYLIVARGAAKSMYGSTIHGYFLNVDTSTTMQITTSPTIRQSDEILSPLRTAISRSRGPLFRFLTEGSLQNTTGSRSNRVKLASTKKGIENFLTGSIVEARPMRVDKLQGARPKVSTVDEWLSGDTREDVIGALEQGASKMDDYLIVCMSSEGTVRNGVGDSIKMELIDILRGDYFNPHVSIWYYCLDDVKEVADPKMWVKAQPNIGKTVSYETYQLDVERAEKNPSARNDILAKRFGIPLEGFTYYFTYEETLLHPRQDFDHMPCALGADLSRGDDFCAFTCLFPLTSSMDKFGVKTRSYITEDTLQKLPPAMRNKYEEFMGEGTLVVMDGTVLDVDGEVFEDVMTWIDSHDYDVLAFGYDPYGAKPFANRWELENGPFGMEIVVQGYKTESVPLGDLKHLAENRALLFDELIMQYTMGNAIAIEDQHNHMRKLLKKSRDEKVDNVAAMLDALVAFKLHRDLFE